MIIDFNVHVERDSITKQYFIDEILEDMVENNIQIRVISILNGKSIKDQNDKVIDLCKEYPMHFLGCAVINPKEDDCVEETKRVAVYTEIKAIEFNGWEHGFLPEKYEHNINPILEICSVERLVVKIFSGWGPRTVPNQWRKYVERFSNVNFVFLHIGGIDFGYGSIPFVKEFENAYFETSGQTEIQVLHKAFSELDAERFLFGSNFPNHFTKCSIDTLKYLELQEDSYSKIFSGNAQRLMR